MEDKITIIEGPPPTFEAVTDGWVLGLYEGPMLGNIFVTRLRTFNGPSLVERCHRAWRNRQSIHLEYRTPEGLEQETPIVAARYQEIDEGHVLELWIRQFDEDVELQLGYDDDQTDEGDEDPGNPDLP